MTPRVEEALAWACELHRGQERKGSDVPYVFHLLAVAALVAEHGGDENQVVAALLHDAVEDAGGDAVRGEIRRRFGDDVAALVEGCTDADTVPKPPWRARKERFLEGLRAAPPRVRLLVAADKLHNAATTLRDLRRDGEKAWERFRGGREGTLWYYAEAVRALGDGWAHPVLEELAEAVRALREAAATDAAREGSRLMSTEEAKSLVRRWYEEVVSTGNVDRVEEFISPDYSEVHRNVRHPLGLHGAREHVLGVRRTYPDLRLTVEQQIAEGEWVVTRATARGTHAGEWMGMRPTGRTVEVNVVNVDRVVGGRIVEHGGAADLLLPLLETGAIRIAEPAEGS